MQKITVEGKTYEYDESKLLLSEAEALEDYLDCNVDDIDAIVSQAPTDRESRRRRWRAIRSIVWLARRRDGETDLKIDDVDFDFSTLQIELVAPAGDDAKAEKKGGRTNPPAVAGEPEQPAA